MTNLKIQLDISWLEDDFLEESDVPRLRTSPVTPSPSRKRSSMREHQVDKKEHGVKIALE